MTQPHNIDREAVAALVEKLRAVESSREPSDWSGIRQVTTNWYRNPDGPEAADLIEKLSRPMEAVAWREKVAKVVAEVLREEFDAASPDNVPYLQMQLFNIAASIADRVQALAVIPNPATRTTPPSP